MVSLNSMDARSSFGNLSSQDAYQSLVSDQLNSCDNSTDCSLPLPPMHSSCDEPMHSTPSHDLNISVRGTLRSQQRRSLPMDYRLLAGMRPKTWSVRSAESKMWKLDDDKKSRTSRRRERSQRVEETSTCNKQELDISRSDEASSRHDFILECHTTDNSGSVKSEVGSSSATKRMACDDEVTPVFSQICLPSVPPSLSSCETDVTGAQSAASKEEMQTIITRDQSTVNFEDTDKDVISVQAGVDTKETKESPVNLEESHETAVDNENQPMKHLKNVILLDHTYCCSQIRPHNNQKGSVTVAKSSNSKAPSLVDCSPYISAGHRWPVSEAAHSSGLFLEETVCSLDDLNNCVYIADDDDDGLTDNSNICAAVNADNQITEPGFSALFSVDSCSLTGNMLSINVNGCTITEQTGISMQAPDDNSENQAAVEDGVDSIVASSSSHSLRQRINADKQHSSADVNSPFFSSGSERCSRRTRMLRDLKLLNRSESIRGKSDVDIVDGITMLSFRSVKQLQKYVTRHCKSTSITARQIKSSKCGQNGRLKKTSDQYHGRRASWHESSELEWHLSLGHIRKLTVLELQQFGLHLNAEPYSSADKHAKTHAAHQCSEGTKAKRGRKPYSSLKFAASRLNRMRSIYRRRAAEVYDVNTCESESFGTDSSSYKLILASVTSAQAAACTECVQADWIDRNSSCAQPGCIFGCICRLFAGRKFSRLVTDTIRLKSRWSAAHASYLKEELARYGYCLNDSVNSEIDDDRKPRKFVNPVKLRGKCDKASNISSAGSFRSRKFARMGCLIPEVSGKRTTMPAYSGVVETNDDATSSAAGRSLSNMDVIAEAGSSLTSENANEHVICSSASASSVSPAPEQRNCENIEKDFQTRTSDASPRQEVDKTIKTAECDKLPESDSAGSLRSTSAGGPVPQKFRKQMVLFQHNRNRHSGNPCLLEITSNCNWDSARATVLGRLFAVTADTVEYPPICTFIVDSFRVEIRPRASQPSSIPPDLRSKLGMPKMYAVRVRITLDGKPEQLAVQSRCNAVWPVDQSESAGGSAWIKDVVAERHGTETNSSSAELYAHRRLADKVPEKVF